MQIAQSASYTEPLIDFWTALSPLARIVIGASAGFGLFLLASVI